MANKSDSPFADSDDDTSFTSPTSEFEKQMKEKKKKKYEVDEW